MFKSHYSDTN